MKRFVGLSLVLFFAGLALVLYAVFFGPGDARKAAEQRQFNGVGEVQYSKNAPGSPLQQSIESGTTAPAFSQPDAKDLQQEQKPQNR